MLELLQHWPSSPPATAAACHTPTTLPQRSAPQPDPLPLGEGGYQCLLDALDVGVLVCDAQGRLLHANAAGEAVLSQSSLLGLQEGAVLHVANPAQSANLLIAVRAAANGRHQLLLLHSGHARLSLTVQPLVAPSVPPQTVLVLLGRASTSRGLGLAMLCQLHDLTAAEERVLTGLLRGQRVSDLAAQHGVKVSTVRSQVAALRAKLGVHRMDEALLMAAELPPMAGAALRCRSRVPSAAN
jgi:DNA-binding NarL/FixJ family response regulator